MKILITGGSGFIGKNLIEYFGQGFEIIAPSHQELELIDEEAVRNYLKQNSVDVLVHGAVRPGHRNATDPAHQLYHNTRMFFNLIRNRDCFDKMIYLGSGLEYDYRYYQPKMSEEYFDTYVPADEGGFSKYIISKYIEKCENVIELRVFGVFGKYEDYTIRFISNLICKSLFDIPLTMKQNRKFDYIYIDDLKTVIEYFLSHTGKYKIYNVTPDKSVELYTLAEKVKNISGKNLPIVVAQEEMGMEYSGSNLRLRNEIKDLKFTAIDDAIHKLYDWYSQNKNLIKHEYLLVDK